MSTLREKANKQRFLEQQQQEEHIAQAPLRAELAQREKLSAENAQLRAELLLTEADPEAQQHGDAAWLNETPTETATLVIRQAALEFMSRYPEAREYFPHPLNSQKLIQYVMTNGSDPTVPETYFGAFSRLRDAGLLAPIERPKPVPATEPKPAVKPTAVSTHESPQEHVGIDPATGRERTYTDVEIEAMDSDTYRRAFSIPRVTTAERPINWR